MKRWLLILLLAGGAARAAPPLLVLDDPGRAWELGEWAEYLEDASAQLDLPGARESSGWRPVGVPRAAFGLRAGVLWLRLRLQPTAAGREPGWRLEFGHPRPIALRGWSLERGVVVAEHRAGLSQPLAERAEASRQVVVPLALGAAVEREVYLRLETRPLGFSGVVTSATESARRAGRELGWFGLYYGVFLALLLYNLSLLVTLRDRAYAWYALVLFGNALFFLSRNGFIWEWGWAADPRSNASGGARIVAFQAAVIAGYARQLLGTAEHLPRVDRALRGAIALGVATIGASALGLLESHEAGVAPFTGAVLVVVLGAGVQRAVRGSRVARVFLAAWAVFLVGAALFILKSAGLVPHTPLTEHALQVGSALEMVLLSIALADRIRDLDRRRAEATRQAELERVEHARAVERLQAEALARVVGGQEAERQRIARELHDAVGHRMVVLLRTAEASAQPEGERLQDVAALAREGLAEVRGIAHDLYPQRLDELGLTAALEAAAESISRTGLEVETRLDAAAGARLSPRARLAALRVAEEALQNTLRHAQARRAWLVLEAAGAGVALQVEDDGRGLGAPVEGLGLRTMRDRAASEGGTLELSARAGGGTRVRLVVPEDGSGRPAAGG